VSGAADTLRTELDAMLSVQDRSGAITTALAAVNDGRIGVLDLYDLVLVPLLVGTGERWQTGAVRVWEEHFASAVVRTIIEAVAPVVIQQGALITPHDRTVLLACPPQEQHDLGLRMLADRFALAGWNAVFLGTDTPVDEICAAATALGAELVVLSASTHFNRVHLRHTVDRIKAGLTDVRVAVGGPAFALDREWPADELFDPVDFGLAPFPAPGEDA